MQCRSSRHPHLESFMDHPYGWLSLLPPLIAIVLAIITRKAIVALLIGVFSGALITAGGNPLRAIWETCEVQLWPTLIDPGKMRVFAFTLLIGALVGIISRSGGMQGLVNVLSRFARGRRSGQLTTWLLGLIVFFDDYTNTILLGSTLRGLFDRLKISRKNWPIWLIRRRHRWPVWHCCQRGSPSNSITSVTAWLTPVIRSSRPSNYSSPVFLIGFMP